MKSFRSVLRAIESEIGRQTAILQSGGRIVQETRGWDEGQGATHSMRSKEEAHDYRYFPDPDLVPMEIDATLIEELRKAIPGLPPERFAKYREYGMDVKQATQLVDNFALADYFDACVTAGADPQLGMNFILGDLSRLANESGTAVNASAVTPAALAELVSLVQAKTINSKIAKELLERMWAGEGSPKAIVEKEGLAQTSDTGEIERLVDGVLATNEKAAADYKAGKTNILGFLTGAVMKASRGKANPALVNELLRKKLG